MFSKHHPTSLLLEAREQGHEFEKGIPKQSLKDS
jgi:hypothetical protein